MHHLCLENIFLYAYASSCQYFDNENSEEIQPIGLFSSVCVTSFCGTEKSNLGCLDGMVLCPSLLAELLLAAPEFGLINIGILVL